MRINEPVTDREIEMTDGEVLISGTDAGGRITFANDAFVQISGFERDELIGQPHNIVRHPTMPKEAFADMWANLKAGNPWEGLVKNRTKQGHLYWVRANVTPVIEEGEIKGFVSIRTKPSRADIAAIEPIYQKWRAGQSGGLRLVNGEVQEIGPIGGLKRRWASVRGRMIMGFGLIMAMIVILAAIDIFELGKSQDRLRSVYEDRLVPSAQLSTVRFSLNTLLTEAGLMLVQPQSAAARTTTARTLLARAERDWQSYLATLLTPEEQQLIQRYQDQRRIADRDAIEPLLAAMAAGDTARVQSLLGGSAEREIDRAMEFVGELIQLQVRVAAEEYSAAQAGYRLAVWETIGILIAIVAAMLFISWSLMRTVMRPVAQFETVCNAIAQGRLTEELATERTREFIRATGLLRALRARLAFNNQEREELTAQAEAGRKRVLIDVADGLEGSVKTVVDQVSAASREIGSISMVSARANQTGSSRSVQVAESADNTRGRITELSSAGEELAASIGEIGRQADNATVAARSAVDDVEQSSADIGKLASAVAEIGSVATLIAEIAEQTNLLALNATIEAARAGDAGRGFAVVASEVKSLAQQTARATEQIAAQIQHVQDQTQGAVQAVARIGTGISTIERMVSSIAGAVEEQRAVTSEIARTITMVTQEMESVSTTIGEAGRTSVEACAGSIEMLWAADDLAASALRLAGDVERYIRDVRDQAA
jgi:PAS domain S-box-containing protein